MTSPLTPACVEDDVEVPTGCIHGHCDCWELGRRAGLKRAGELLRRWNAEEEETPVA